MIIETSLASGRDILRGIARFMKEHGPWSIYLEPRGLEDDAPSWLRQWDGDGVLARFQNERIAQAALATGIPVVDLLAVVPHRGAPRIDWDDRGIARLAAEHLLTRGFRSFGFLGISGANWSAARREEFGRAVGEAGYVCRDCELPPDTRGRATWEEQQRELGRWIEALPRPVGIMACNDPRGLLLLESCRRLGLAVPEEAAIIGVDNDVPLCEIADPPLSSVIPDHPGVGYAGALLLDQLMARKEVPQETLSIPPLGVATRLSTDVLAIGDPNVAAAVRFIREHACNGIRVDDVVDHVAMSRSSLQRRFRQALGRSVHDDILRFRLRRVKELLSTTGLSMEMVTEKAGFSHRQYLGEVFKAETGETLVEYRKRHRQANTAQIE